jgi:hypothetical protein
MEEILFYHILQMADWYKNYFWKPHDWHDYWWSWDTLIKPKQRAPLCLSNK